MSKRLAIGVALIVIVIATSVFYAHRQLVEAGYPSCALSIEDSISQRLRHGMIDEVVVSDEWQKLSEEQERALFADFRSRGLTFDCVQFPQFADGSALAGDKGQIRFRREGPLISVRIESDENHARPY